MDVKLDQLFQDHGNISETIFNTLAEGIVVANTLGEFLYFNDVAEEILGFGMINVNPSQWSEQYGCYEIDQKTPLPSENLPLAQTLQTGKIHNKVFYVKNSLKVVGTYIDVTSSPIRGAQNKLLGAIAVFRDISKLTQTESSLKQSQDRLSAHFKGFPMPTYVWKNHGDDFLLIDYNDNADEFTDGTIRKLVGSKFSTVYPKEEFHSIHDDFWESYNYQKCINREIQYKMRTTGEIKELHVYYVFIPPNHIAVHTMDITQRKKSEILLQKLSNAVKQTADGVLITNSKGVIEYVNPAFEKMTGYNREQAIGQTPKILQSGEHANAFYKELWLTISNGQPFKGELINKKQNGEHFWVQNTITPIIDNSGKIINYVSVIKDITDLKAKQELEIRLQIAREIQQRLYANDVHIPGYDIVGKCFPADETGGDYLDIIQDKNGGLWLAIADVSNHGIGPALIMAGTRAYLRAFLDGKNSPGEILYKINNMLVEDLDEQKYVTMLLVHLNVNEHYIEYASAGHVPAYLLNTLGKVKHELESTGIPLGYLQDMQFENVRIDKISSGDLMILLTDGLIEMHDKNDEEFGTERILEIVSHYRNKGAGKIIEKLYQNARRFKKNVPFEDDITALVCKLDDIHKCY